ncbi:MAG TPA: DUF2975 domain-containing protein [Solirubrobacteraceae bacterium]|nr:DUF2975 domain-containing protein [Solirubrobacteraceae bacterium]
MERRRWTTERVALWLAVLFVLGGALDAGWDVAHGVGDRRVEVRGELDVDEILRTHHPSPPDAPAPDERFPAGYAYLSDGHGTLTVPEAEPGAIVAWSILRLAPWLAALAVLAFLVPILRAAGRGDPFARDATRRMRAVGSLLLVGIPAYAVIEYFAAEASLTHGVAPEVSPVLTLGVTDVLPGLLVLVLAGVFARGVELQELERQTV